MEISLVPLLLTSGELSWPDSAVKIPPHLAQSTETAQYSKWPPVRSCGFLTRAYPNLPAQLQRPARIFNFRL